MTAWIRMGNRTHSGGGEISLGDDLTRTLKSCVSGAPEQYLTRACWTEGPWKCDVHAARRLASICR